MSKGSCMLDNSTPAFLTGMAIVVLSTLGVMLLVLSFAFAYKSLGIVTNLVYLAIFMLLILPLLILENMLFLSYYFEGIAVSSNSMIWKFSVAMAALGVSVYQLRFLDSLNHYWRILYPLGLFTGTLIGAALSTLEIQQYGGKTRVIYSSPVGAVLVGLCFFLVTLTSVVSISLALNTHGSFYPEEIISSSKWELLASTMLMLSSVILTLHRVAFPDAQPLDFFLLFASFGFIAEAYAIVKNPFPIHVPADARALLFSLYDKEANQELSRIEVTGLSKESAGLYSLALTGISGILTEITHSTDIDAFIAGQTSHIIVSGREPYVAFMITTGKNISMPTSALKYFLRSLSKEGVSRSAIEKFSKRFLSPLFHHANYIVLHPLLTSHLDEKKDETRDHHFLSQNY